MRWAWTMSRAAIRAPIVTDSEFFASEPRADQNAKCTAFGMTKRAGRSASPTIRGFRRPAGGYSADAICLVAKSLGLSCATWRWASRNDGNVDAIAESVQAVSDSMAARPMIDCEHFLRRLQGQSRTMRSNAPRTAFHESGARWVILCDTNGGSRCPNEIAEIVSRSHRGDSRAGSVGIHTHNDTENAVANTLAAVRAGARQIQGTLNGHGRALRQRQSRPRIIPTLMLKSEFADRVRQRASRPARLLQSLTHASRVLGRDSSTVHPTARRLMWANVAFATKAGIHASAIMKDPRNLRAHSARGRGQSSASSYVSDQAGRSNVLAELARIGIDGRRRTIRGINTLLGEVKQREAVGLHL